MTVNYTHKKVTIYFIKVFNTYFLPVFYRIFYYFKNNMQSLESQDGVCLNISDHRTKLLIVLNSIANGAAFLVMCLLVVGLLCTRAHKKYENRLYLYLSAAAILTLVSDGLQKAPLTNFGGDVIVRHGWEGFCKAMGFMDTYTNWIQQFVMLWVVLYVFTLASTSVRLNKRKHELLGIGVAILFPLVISWIPFVGDKYGQAGLWCWINGLNSNGTQDTLGLTYQIALYYGPTVVLLLLETFAIGLTISITCRNTTARKRIQQPILNKHNNIVKQCLPLLVYLLCYNMATTVDMAHRINLVITCNKQGGKSGSFTFWMVHSILAPLQLLILPAALVFKPKVYKKLHQIAIKKTTLVKKLKTQQKNRQINTPANTEIDPLDATESSITSNYGACDKF